MIRRLSISPATSPETYTPPAERLVAGQPTQRLWPQYADARNEFFVGVWESEPGSWRVHYTEEEYCRILEGRSRLIAANGTVDDVRAGDEFVIPRGFEGVWEVIERTRKVYVIHERTEPVGADGGAAR